MDTITQCAQYSNAHPPLGQWEDAGSAQREGLPAQQNAGDSILPQLLGVMHVPSQHAPLLPQLTPVVPADGQIECVNAELTCRSSETLSTTTENGGHKCPVHSTTSRRAEPTARSAQVGRRASHVGGGVTQVLPSVPQILPAAQHVVPDAQVFRSHCDGRQVEQAEAMPILHEGETLGILPTAQHVNVSSPDKRCDTSQQSRHAVRRCSTCMCRRRHGCCRQTVEGSSRCAKAEA